MTGRDVVVTVPRKLWAEWLAEGDLAPVDGTPSRRGRAEYGFLLGGQPPSSVPGRVYVVAGGRLRGYAPLLRIERWPATGRFGARHGQYAFVRSGDAVACTIPEEVRGFRDFRYRWWEITDEVAFPDWRTAGIG